MDPISVSNIYIDDKNIDYYEQNTFKNTYQSHTVENQTETPSAEYLRQRGAELDRREQQLAQKENALNARERNVSQLEEKWYGILNRMEENAAKLPSTITINIRGTNFEVPKSNLLKNQYFAAMLTSDHAQYIDGKYFIDYNPKHFHVVLDYLSSGKILNYDGSLEELEEYFRFFLLPDPGAIIAQDDTPKIFDGSLISRKLQSPFQTWLPDKTFSLLYKASRDEFIASKFHAICDDKGPTLTIIQSVGGYLFGGYSHISWTSIQKKQSMVGYLFSGWGGTPRQDIQVEDDSFIFTLVNPHAIPPTQYKHIPGKSGPQNHPDQCACFGGKLDVIEDILVRQYDIYIASNANRHSLSHSRFPMSYEDTTGKGNCTFTGEKNFIVTEVEVYMVKNK